MYSEDDDNCTCGNLTYWSEVWTDIFQEPIQFFNVTCPVHGKQKQETRNVESE